MGKIKLGIMGGGRGADFLNSTPLFPDVELVAVCDFYKPILERMQFLAENRGMNQIKYYMDFEANKAVLWKTSNKKYATVDKNGKITLKKAGAGKSVTITAIAKDGSGKKASIKIKIMKHTVKSIKLEASSETLKAGKSMKLKATIKTTGKSVNKTLKWTSSNTKYAKVSSKGKVTAKKAGKGKAVTITATSTDGSNKKAKVKIRIK